MELDGDLLVQPGSWRKLGPLASDVRRAVFIIEQGIDEAEEWDDMDEKAVHWVALLDGEAIGCARLSPEGKIGRMAVLPGYRGRGVGSRLLLACVDYAAQRDFAQVRLSAQQHALSFYEKHGFRTDGDPHEEVGIPHQWMVRDLDVSEAPAAQPLSQYMERVRALLDTLPAAWVTGTLSELRRQGSGHVYFTLVQTAPDGQIESKVRAVMWRNAAAVLEQRFRQSTGLSLANNQDVMLKVHAQSHAVHGFSLVVEDIHPEFTVGRLAARLDQIRRQLKSEGLFDRNRQWGLPDDYFRVAVLSPADAAGLGDFRSRADALMAAGIVHFVYFTATFQGTATAASVCSGLRKIEAEYAQAAFDAVVIIRGGGSEWDLACLNEIDIARAVCQLSMPVLCGIGHERDSTIIDEIACHRLATPSMVIDFIETTVMSRLQRVVVNMRDIRRLALTQTQRAQERSGRLMDGIRDLALKRTELSTRQIEHTRAQVAERAQAQIRQAQQSSRQQQSTVAERARRDVDSTSILLETLRHERIPQAVRQRLESIGLRMDGLAEQVRAHDPQTVLQRGYAVLLDEQGQPLPSVDRVRASQKIRARLRDGEVALDVTPDQPQAGRRKKTGG